MKTQLLAAIVISLAATATAQAAGNPIQPDPITVKVESPVFLPPTPSCAAGRAHTSLQTPNGAVIGSSIFCIASATFDFETATLVQVGTLTFYLPGGAIVAETTIVDQLAVYPFAQSVTGTVVGGTGLYSGASGALAGGGEIFFDQHGDFDPDTTLVLDLD